MTELAARRKLDDLTIGPVLTVRIPNANVNLEILCPSFDDLESRFWSARLTIDTIY